MTEVNLIEVNEPWKHYIVENFLEVDDFKELEKWVDSLPNAEPKDRYNEWVTDSSKVVKAKERFENLLSEINFVPRIPYRIEVEYNSVGQDYDYPIHTDSPDKFVTLVLYVSPEDNQGTRIHNFDKTFHSEVKWKKNSGLLFEIKDDTFHTYKSKFSSRKTINIICLEEKNQKLGGRRY